MDLEDNEEGPEGGDEFLKGLFELRQIIIPEWDTEKGIISKFITVSKWISCLSIGIGLLVFLTVSTTSDPFLSGTETLKISQIPFPSIGITPEYFLSADYYEKMTNFFKKIGGFPHQKDIGHYENWTMDAAKKLAYLVDHMCSKPISLMARHGLQNQYDWESMFKNVNTSFDQIFDNIEDFDLKYFVIPDMKNGIISCENSLDLKLWNSKKDSFDINFYEVLTDAGITCIFNSRPLAKTERSNTLKGVLGYQYSKQEINLWKNVDFDKFSNEDYPKKEEVNPVLVQNVPGQPFGLSFVVQGDKELSPCPHMSGKGFRLTLTHPRGIHYVVKYGKPLAYGFEYFVSVTPIARILGAEINTKDIKFENCCVGNGCQSSLETYSHSECMAQCVAELVFKKCNCTTIDMYGSKNRKFCKRIEIQNDVAYYQSYVIRNQANKCPQCKPSCNDVEYKTEITSIPMLDTLMKDFDSSYTRGPGKGEFAVVHIFYGVGVFEATVMRIRRFFSELIGIITGMLGSSMDLTFPRVWDFTIALLGVVGSILYICWRSCLPLITRCFNRVHTLIISKRRLPHVLPITLPSRVSPALSTNAE